MKHQHYIDYVNKNDAFFKRLNLFCYYHEYCHLKKNHDLLQNKFFEVLEEARAYRKKSNTLQNEIDQMVKDAKPELTTYFKECLDK